jgi:hypothetical protein
LHSLPSLGALRSISGGASTGGSAISLTAVRFRISAQIRGEGRLAEMTRRTTGKRADRVRSEGVWIQPELNDELDPRKLSRAFMALALYQAAQEAAAQGERTPGHGDGDRDERA